MAGIILAHVTFLTFVYHHCLLWQVTPVYADPPMRPEHYNVHTDIDKHTSRIDLKWKKPNANGHEITAYVVQRQIRKQTEWGNDIEIPPSSREK